MVLVSFFLPLVLGGFAAAVKPNVQRRPGGMRTLDMLTDEVWHRANKTRLAPLSTIYYFDQLIDHENPSLGTFKQRYWFNYQQYEPGGPIILMNGGEADASGFTGYLDNQTITGVMADKFNGAVVVYEHRFFGESNPYPDLSVKSFRVHTLQQSLDDLEYFAKNVKLPMPGGDQVAAPGKAPWIHVGGSYPGALTSFVMHNKPGVFYAGYASSAVVQALADFWGYFEPIREHMPQNCSADIQAVIAHVDGVLASGDAAQIRTLKDAFGLADLEYNDDFAAQLMSPLQSWQDLQPTSGPGGTFYGLCDSLEVDGSGKSAGPQGWGLQHALSAWGAYTKSSVAARCGKTDIESCLSTYDTENPFWTDTTVNNWSRSWQWLLCTQFGFWFDGAPKDTPTLVSRILTPAYNQRQCVNFFPEAFNKSAPVNFLTALDVNVKYGGWNVTTERIVFINGERDPWREATVAANGVSNKGTDMQPHLLADGFHTSDMLVADGQVSARIRQAQEQALQYIEKWLADWKPSA